jgi:hypothetical protein
MKYDRPDAVLHTLVTRYSNDGLVFPQLRVTASVRKAAVTHFGSWEAAVAEAGLTPRRPREYPERICSVTNCRRPRHSRGLCARHYQRQRQYGTIDRTTDQSYDVSFRFWRHILLEDVLGDGCWLWRGTTAKGYGVFSVYVGKLKTTVRVHRFAYEQMVGPIPAGMTIDHMCHDSSVCAGGVDCPHRRCVNPAHLAVATIGENAGRSLRGRRKLTCIRGHALDYSTGHGICNTCRNQALARRRARKREAIRSEAALSASLPEGNRGLSNAC